ncbi:MAG TPA: amino acid adenylation domain-containing protein [Pyrinomonadaceae bacterium]|nr:amino acid adenylation domain-containing protein [Pyrinomonadaceae bacterium]
MFDQADIENRRSKLSPTKRDLLAKLLREGNATAGGNVIPQRNTGEPAPLSFAQQRLWFLEQLTPGSAAYNISRKVTFKGPLCVATLQQSLNELFRRHESLRTSFSTVADNLVQCVAPPAEFPLQQIDLTHDQKQNEKLEQLARSHAQHVFDLAVAPLLRATLVHLSEDEHTLLLSFHHLISDGWSVNLFFRELAALYPAFTADQSSPLTEPQIQYADYAVWQRQLLQDEVRARHLTYWKEQLSGAHPALELPAEKVRRAAANFSGARQRFRLAEDLTEALRDLAQREGVSLFMLLSAAFNALLYRYTRQDDISVGVPVAERSPRELEDLVGLFVNTVVLRTRLRNDLTFRELLQSTREVALAAFLHQELPFEQVVEALQTNRNAGRTPLFETMFALHGQWFERWTMAGVECTAEVIYGETSQFDLSLEITENESDLDGFFEYRTDLFEDTTFARMSRHFEILLQGIVKDPDRLLIELPLLDQGERQQLLLEGVASRSRHTETKCIHELVAAQAARTPNAVAVSFGEQQLTYSQLDTHSNQLAHYLKRRGLTAGMLVALLVDQQVEMAVGILGILKAGGAYVPLDPVQPPDRIAFMTRDAGVSLAVTQRSLADKLRASDPEVINLDGGWDEIAREHDQAPAVMVHPENLAYVIYTSGSTGQPKGVLVPHRAVVNHALCLAAEQALHPGDRVLQFASISFDTAAEELFPTWFAGATVVTKGREAISTAEFSELLRKQEISIINLPTAYWHTWVADLQRTGQNLPDTVRLLNVGGEKALTERLETWLKIADDGVRWLNTYGPTEATITTTVLNAATPLSWQVNSVPIGKPIENTAVYVLDELLEPVPLGVPGELFIGGLGLAHGYAGRPELTAEWFIPHPFSTEPGARLYRTGDVVRYLPDLAIEYLGRKDQQVKISGYRIELGEIEAALLAHGEIRETAVVAQRFGPDEQRLVAYFATPGDDGPTNAELRRYLATRLPDYMIPSVFVKLPQLPLTTTKKVDRRALAAMEVARPDLKRASVAPRNSIEAVLLKIWIDVLQLAGMGVDDNFFELGGHSLLAMKLVSRISQTFNRSVPLSSLFAAPTVAQLAKLVESARDQRDESLPIRPIDRTKPAPLSFAQERFRFLHEYQGASAFYNVSSPVLLTGQLDLDALRRSLAGLVARHETLRTSFRMIDGEPVQIIEPQTAIDLELEDLSHLDEAQRESELKRIVTEETQQPFDLTAGRPWRVKLLCLGADSHVLLLTLHHIASDDWSTGVLANDLARFYSGFVSAVPPDLAPLPIQYADYAAWQREWLDGEVLEDHLAYWRTQLEGAPRNLDLPTDKPRPAVQTFHGARQSIRFSQGLTRELEVLSHQEGVTLFMTLLAAFQTLLWRYSNQEDIVVGSPIAGRTRVETEALIGCFINTLALRTKLSGNPSFRELLGRVRQTTLDAYEHQELPFEKLVELLQPERDLSRSPLFQAMLVFQEPPLSLELPGLHLETLNFESSIAVRTDVDLYLWRDTDGLRGSFIYNPDLFEAASIERMAQHFRLLLESIVREPSAALFDLQFDLPLAFPAISAANAVEATSPLSYHQERLWFIDQFEKGNVYQSSPTYHNIPLILHFEGPLDSSLLAASLNLLLSRHPVLRTKFTGSEGGALQTVSANEELRLQVVDAGAGASLAEVVEQAVAEARQPFILDRDLLARATLFQMKRNEWLFVLTLHHIIADKKSLSLIGEELSTIYSALSEGRTPQLPDLSLQYTDYAAWQHNLPRETMDQLRFYWRQQLRGKLRILELPEDRPRPAVHTYTDARIPFSFGADLSQRLKQQGKQFDLFAMLLAGFKVLLRRYAQQDEIVVGTSVACRTQPGTENVVGPFANLLVLRSDLSGAQTFRGILVALTETIERAQAHQEMPFDKLVQELNPEKDMSRTALFDVLFQFAGEEPQLLDFRDAKARVIDTNLGFGKYDLNVSIHQEAGELAGVLVYNADIYDRVTMQQMLNHFEVILKTMSVDLDQHLDDISLLTETEERQQLVTWNSTGADYPRDKTIHQLFAEQVKRTPDNVAVVFGNHSLTYRELDERANRLAHQLQKLGAAPDMLIGVCLNRSLDMIVALLGVLKAGAAYLPLDPNYPKERLDFTVNDSKLLHLITQKDLVENLPASAANLILIDADNEEIAKLPATAPATHSSPDNVAYCIYTSGSTGEPKGVLLNHCNVVRLLVNDKLQFDFTAQDVWTMFHSYCFDFSVWEMYGALLYGGKLVVVPEETTKDPALFLDLIAKEKVTVLNQTPTAFFNLAEQALQRSEASLAALRYVIFGGEALHPVQLKQWREQYRAVRLINMYGITETTVHVTFKEITPQEIADNVSNIGRPIPTTTTYIMDANLRLLPVGVRGEIVVGGAGVARGYVGRDDLTRQKFVPNPYRPEERLYRSGDLARLLHNGDLVYLGRLDDQVQIRGFRVELGEIRSRLLKYPQVSKAEVVARPIRGDIPELIAYVVTAGEVNVTELRNHLVRSLPHYMIPAAIVLLKDLPLTANGKVDRKALPPVASERPDLETSYTAPRTPVEDALLGIWTKVLGLERLGVNDDFFALGGHSILAMKLIALVQEAFHVAVPLRKLFEQPTVAAFAETIETALREGIRGSQLPMKRISQNGDLPLSFNQEARLFRDWWDSLRRAPAAPFQMHIALRLTGVLDVAALERAFAETSRRHSVLRTTFQPPRGLLAHRFLHPVIDKILSSSLAQKRLRKVSRKKVWKSSFFRQVVNDQNPFKIRVVDLSTVPAAAQEAEVQRRAFAEVSAPLDYTKDLLIRALLLRLRDDEHVLVATVSHLSSDAWSFQVLFREIAQNYQAFASNQDSPVPEPAYQYSDFAYWQRELMSSEAREELISYWEKRFSNFPLTPELDLPFARPPASVPTYKGATQIRTITPELYAALKDLARQQKVTMYMLLLAAFVTLLARYSGKQRISLFVIFANRNRPEMQSLIGWVSNVQAFNTDLSRDARFVDLLDHVRTMVLDDYAHQEIPFPLLFGELLQRTKNYKMPRRLYQASYVFFDLLVENESAFQFPGLTVSRVEIPSRTGDELTMLAVETTEQLKIRLNYSVDRFDDAKVEQVLNDFEALLREVSQRPSLPLAELINKPA